MHDMSAFAWVGIGVGFHQGGKKKRKKEKPQKKNVQTNTDILE